MTPEHWQTAKSLVSVAWVAIGPLVGVWTGAYLAKQWQREQWIADNKRAEYRKLLSTLAKTFTALVELRVPGRALGPKEQRKILNLEVNAGAVIMDRLFIAGEIKEINLVVRWHQALRDFARTRDCEAFGRAYYPISDDLLKSAAKIIQKRQRWTPGSFVASIIRRLT